MCLCIDVVEVDASTVNSQCAWGQEGSGSRGAGQDGWLWSMFVMEEAVREGGGGMLANARKAKVSFSTWQWKTYSGVVFLYFMFHTKATPSGSWGASSLLLYEATRSSGYWRQEKNIRLNECWREAGRHAPQAWLQVEKPRLPRVVLLNAFKND